MRIYIYILVRGASICAGRTAERNRLKDRKKERTSRVVPWPSQDTVLFQGLCARINPILCEHGLCLAPHSAP